MADSIVGVLWGLFPPLGDLPLGEPTHYNDGSRGIEGLEPS